MIYTDCIPLVSQRFELYVHSPLSATIGTRQLVDNRGWRIIERGGESRATELRKSVPMVLMADNQNGG